MLGDMTLTLPWQAHQVRINHAGRTACAPNWAWTTDQTAWRDLDLWVVLSGRGTMHSPDGAVPLRRGSAWLLRGGERYAGEQDLEDRLVVSHTHFDLLAEDGSVLPWHATALPPRARQVVAISSLEDSLRRLLEAERTARNSTTARTWLVTALLYLCDQDQRDQTAEPLDDLDRAIERCCEDLRADPASWPGVEGLARACHCHPDHFTRRFKRRVGTSPSRFLTQLRMERARSLLRYTTLSAAQIAHEIGYHDQAYFNRVFTTVHGSAPGRWRQGSWSEATDTRST